MIGLSIITTGCSNEEKPTSSPDTVTKNNIATQSNIAIDTSDLNKIDFYNNIVFYASAEEEAFQDDYNIDMIKMTYSEFEEKALDPVVLEATGIDEDIEINTFIDVVDYLTVSLDIIGEDVASSNPLAAYVDIPEMEELYLEKRDLVVYQLSVNFMGQQTMILVPVEEGFITITVVSDSSDYPEEIIEEVLATIHVE